MMKRAQQVSLILVAAAVAAGAVAAQPSYVWPDYSVHRTAYHGQLDRRSLGGNRMHSDSPSRMATAGKTAGPKKMAAVASVPAAAIASAPQVLAVVTPLAETTPAPATRSALPDLPPPQDLTVEQRWQRYSYP